MILHDHRPEFAFLQLEVKRDLNGRLEREEVAKMIREVVVETNVERRTDQQVWVRSAYENFFKLIVTQKPAIFGEAIL
nr:hypothetical protein CFP56_40091 [Quercus suber]